MVRYLSGAAVAAALFVSPAVAQNTDRSHEVALRQLQNPQTANAIAALVEALARSLMAMPVGPLADAMAQVDPDSDLADVPRDATLGEVARVDARDAERLGDDAHAAGTMVTGMARQLEVMLPTFEAMARDMSAQWSQDWDRARRTSRRR
ncbi:MAG: hypothetical protein AABZ45_04285 [Pseudomonadota bacterium]